MLDLAQPWWLAPSALYLLLVWRFSRTAQPTAYSISVSARHKKSWILHGLTLAALALAAAGLQTALSATQRQLAIAVDVSDSVFDLSSQTVRLNQLLAALPPDETQAAFVVFGKNAGIEQPLRPLPDLSQATGRTRSRSPALPDISRPTTLVDRSATSLGNAIATARGLLDGNRSDPRAIVLLSDFRDTVGQASAAASALNGSGIDLLAIPAALGPAADVRLAALEIPAAVTVGRSVPIEAIVASQTACSVRVSLWRKRAGSDDIPVGFKTVKIEAPPSGAADTRVAVRFLDTAEHPGIALYTARLSGTESDLAGDILTNNSLSAAVRVLGPSRWAVLARTNSTLAGLVRQPTQPLGVEAQLFVPGALPTSAQEYAPFAGILVDGLSQAELSAAALSVLSEAVDSGKALVALGGDTAFGAGGHTEGAWERMLPVEMTPEDDRTRSILFLIDVSKSMDETIRRGGSPVSKKDFAAEQLAQAVQKLKPSDRLGLIAFSGTAKVTAPLSSEPGRAAFLAAVRSITTEASTDLLAPLKLARETLAKDDAEEQLIVLLSDGVQTASATADEIAAEATNLCPLQNNERRATLFTFGIGVDDSDANPVGEALLKRLAGAGGGTFSPQFLKLAERLEKTFEGRKKDFLVRRENFGVRTDHPHSVLDGIDAWPALAFRNRVKSKPGSETLLWSARLESAGGSTSRRPDPLLVLSGAGASHLARRAAFAVGLDGPAGAQLLAAPAAQRLLPSLLAWAEGRTDAASPWSVQLEPNTLGAFDLVARGKTAEGQFISGLKLKALVQPLTAQDETVRENQTILLKAAAPGTYRAPLSESAQGVYRVALMNENRMLQERFITLPYPAEARNFGVDRAAMQSIIALAGGDSQALESPRDLAAWAAKKNESQQATSLIAPLLIAALALLLAQIYVRLK